MTVYPTVDAIKNAVIAAFGITMPELMGEQRSRRCARPRQVAMYLASKMTKRSLGEIGRLFHRDHTSVMHAIETVEALLERDPEIRQGVEHLRQYLATRVIPSTTDAAVAIVHSVMEEIENALVKQARRNPKAMLEALSRIVQAPIEEKEKCA